MVGLVAKAAGHWFYLEPTTTHCLVVMWGRKFLMGAAIDYFPWAWGCGNRRLEAL